MNRWVSQREVCVDCVREKEIERESERANERETETNKSMWPPVVEAINLNVPFVHLALLTIVVFEHILKECFEFGQKRVPENNTKNCHPSLGHILLIWERKRERARDKVTNKQWPLLRRVYNLRYLYMNREPSWVFSLSVRSVCAALLAPIDNERVDSGQRRRWSPR